MSKIRQATKMMEYEDGTIKCYRSFPGRGWLLHSIQENQKNKPAVESSTGYKAFFREGKYHNEKGPARLWAHSEGEKEYWLAGRTVGRHEYWLAGQMYEDKKAYQCALDLFQNTKVEKEQTDDGEITRHYRKVFGEWLIHRDGDLPAVEGPNGFQEWVKFGARHRDGCQPARIIRNLNDIQKEYWLHGVHYEELEDYQEAMENTKFEVRKPTCHSLARDHSLRGTGDVYSVSYYRKDGNRWVLHRDGDLPAELRNKYQTWYQMGKRHREGDLPAIVHKTGKKEWFFHDKLHRIGAPSIIITSKDDPQKIAVKGYYLDGTRYFSEKIYHEKCLKNYGVGLGDTKMEKNDKGAEHYYKKNNQGAWVLHRDYDRPAVITKNGYQAWYQDDQLHRDGDQPAVIRSGGTREWYQKGQLHRDHDRPAIECATGDKEWYQKGQRHRDHDRPAVEKANGDKEWYQNGRLHRDHDLPARITGHYKMWYRKGNCHRDYNRPAIEHADGRNFYYLNGDEYHPHSKPDPLPAYRKLLAKQREDLWQNLASTTSYSKDQFIEELLSVMRRERESFSFGK